MSHRKTLLSAMPALFILLAALLSGCEEQNEVWIYTSVYKEVVEEMKPLVQQAFPDIRVQWYQGGSENIASKLNAELAVGRPKANLILTSDPFWYYELKENGDLLPHPGPPVKDLLPDLSDSEFAYRAIRLPVMVIGYNSDLIQPEELPRTWDELADPKWKGKIAMPSPLESGTSFTTVALLSRKLGWSYFQKLRELDILAAGGNSSVLNRIETRERPIGILLLENIVKAQGKGSPVRPHYPEDGVIPIASPIAILKNAGNHEATRKVYDWFFTPEAQLPIVKSGLFSLVEGAPSPKDCKPLAELKDRMVMWNQKILTELYQDRDTIKAKFTEIVLRGNPSKYGPTQSSSIILEATLRSLALSLCVALLSGFLGMSLAWLVTRTSMPGAGVLSRLLSVPYTLPAYLLGMAWIILANPTVGLLKDWIPGSYGFWAMVMVEASVAFAFPFLELTAGFARMDSSLEEAARMSGASPSQVFRHVSFPLLWPSLVNGMCLSFLYTLASFGVPALLGLPVREFVLTTLIYSQLKLGGAAGIQAGMLLSLLLLTIAGAVLFLSNRITMYQRGRITAIMGAKTSRPSLVDLGEYTWPATVLAWGFFSVAVILPWCGLALAALAPVAGNYNPSAWTLRNIFNVFQLTEFRQALWNSLTLALLVSAMILVLGFLLGFAAVRRKSRVAAWAVEILAVPFAIPGTVLAIIVIFASTWLQMGSILFWMGMAYGLKYSAIAARMYMAAFYQVDPVLEEAARMSGAGTFRLLKDIWAPLLKKTALAAFLLSMLPMFTELTMSVLLTGPGAATMGTVLFQLQEYADQSSAAALAWILLTLALVLALTARRGTTTENQV